MLGENPQVEHLSRLQWAFFVVFTVMLNVIMLNLLIAILCNSYQTVKENMQPIDCKIKADMLLEVSALLIWRRNNQELVYLHFFNQASDALAVEEKDDYMTRLTTVMDKLDSIKEDQAS